MFVKGYGFIESSPPSGLLGSGGDYPTAVRPADSLSPRYMEPPYVPLLRGFAPPPVERSIRPHSSEALGLDGAQH